MSLLEITRRSQFCTESFFRFTDWIGCIHFCIYIHTMMALLPPLWDNRLCLDDFANRILLNNPVYVTGLLFTDDGESGENCWNWSFIGLMKHISLSSLLNEVIWLYFQKKKTFHVPRTEWSSSSSGHRRDVSGTANQLHCINWEAAVRRVPGTSPSVDTFSPILQKPVACCNIFQTRPVPFR